MDAGANELPPLSLRLQRFEKKFHRPPGLVEIANRLGGQGKAMGAEAVLVSGLRIPVRDLPQFPLVSSTFKPEDRIAAETLCPVCLAALHSGARPNR